MKEKLAAFKARHPSAYQFIMFAYLGIYVSAIDIAVYSLCNYLIFSGLAATPFSWWLIKYPVSAGGLCALLSFGVSFAVSQTFSFIINRKKTFEADNNVALSALLYAAMVLITYFFQLWLPSLVGPAIYGWIGATWGGLLIKCFNMTSSMLIQFPINKWVIMRKRGKGRRNPAGA